jgi:hypothetical protein
MSTVLVLVKGAVTPTSSSATVSGAVRLVVRSNITTKRKKLK